MLKRLARRLIYFKSPHLFEEAERRVIADDIAARRRGEGSHASPPWTTIAQALSELETIDAEVSDTLNRPIANYDRAPRSFRGKPGIERRNPSTSPSVRTVR